MNVNIDKARRARALREQGKSAQSIARLIQEELGETKHLITAGYALDLQQRLGLDEDGRLWNVSHAAILAAIDSAQCPPTVREGSSDQIASPASLSFGERVLRICLGELSTWGAKPVPDAQRAEYFRGCQRSGSTQVGNWLALEEVKPGVDNPFCIAARGWAERRAALPGEDLPPWRASVMEAMLDSIEGRRPGERWMSIAEVRAGAVPPPGSLVIYGNTRVPGRGHAETLLELTGGTYRSIGANETFAGRRHCWVEDIEPIRLAEASRADGSQRLQLLGFSVPA